MKDADFVALAVPELITEYQDAKGYILDVPTQALVQIRSMAYKLCDLLAKKQLTFTSPNLYGRIEQLNQQRLIDIPTTRALHKLRGYGNRGAHPEKYHLNHQQLQTLANKALLDCLALLEHLYTKWHRKTVPDYQYDNTDGYSVKNLCYRAIMEDDAKAQYQLGMAFKSQGLMAQQAIDLSIDDQRPNKNNNEAAKLLSKAAYWFAQAATKYNRALFEHGVALLHGYEGAADNQKGEMQIAQAAQEDLPPAQALLGYFYLVGSECFKQDFDQAEYWLSAAAKAGNTEAMANLGVLYYQQSILPQAFNWISQAAKSGFANAQYHLALMLAKGEGCEQDLDASETWLAEAAEQGQLDAMLQCARNMLNQDNVFAQDLSQAEDYLRQVIRYEQSVPAMLELSTALTDGILGRIDVVGAANLLKLARDKANDEEMQILQPLWYSLKQQIDKVLPLTNKADEQEALKHAARLLS